MTCRFDLDCFNTRRFKPYTGKMQVSANYLSESDREGKRHGEKCEAQWANFHTFWPALPHSRQLSPRSARCSTGLPSVCCCSNLTCLVAVQIWYDNTHLVIHVHVHPCVQWSLDHLLPFGSEREKKRREVPLGMFLSLSQVVWRIAVHGWKVNWTLTNPQCVSD